MEESVFRHLNHLERSGYRSDYDEFHSLADPIYELPEDDREGAFEKVNRLFFLERLKLGDHVLRALEAVGLIPKRKRTVKKSALVQKNEVAEIESPEEVSEEAETLETIARGNVTDGEETTDMEEEVTAVAELEDDDEPEQNDEVSYDLAREFEERIKEVVVKRGINKVDEGS
ncbi:MAG: hypothetical protein OSA05_05295, partial [Nitrospinaceae bacterium]|nr:hypothetical protein [Nitrospinaceae bacterium]